MEAPLPFYVDRTHERRGDGRIHHSDRHERWDHCTIHSAVDRILYFFSLSLIQFGRLNIWTKIKVVRLHLFLSILPLIAACILFTPLSPRVHAEFVVSPLFWEKGGGYSAFWKRKVVRFMHLTVRYWSNCLQGWYKKYTSSRLRFLTSGYTPPFFSSLTIMMGHPAFLLTEKLWRSWTVVLFWASSLILTVPSSRRWLSRSETTFSYNFGCKSWSISISLLNRGSDSVLPSDWNN